MARNLSIGLMALALSSSVAWAQNANDQETDSALADEILVRQNREGSAFQLFQHGIWPKVQTLNAIERQSAKSEVKRDERRKIKRTSISRSASSRRSVYLSSIRAAERKHDLPFGLLDALIWAESRYNPSAISPAGAVGLAQLMPGTASDLGVRNRYDPDANINGGALYLRQMLDQFGGVHLALAAYNAGPNAVKRAKGIPKNRETPDYVRSVIARWTKTRS